MTLNVKNKIWLGTSFLFLLLLLMGGVGIYYMAKLKKEARNILMDNYESVSYCHNMQQQLINFELDEQQSIREFEKSLQLQEANITEPNEAAITVLLRQYFNNLKRGDSIKKSLQLLNLTLQETLALNMAAIQRKNDKAETTADEAFTLIVALAGFVFIIAFTFLVNFPSVVTKPIAKLTEAIKEIGSKNYKHRIHIDNKDEFGKLADAFNEMAERLEFFESSNLNKLLFEKNRAEAVINSLKDASIGVDKNNIVLFANFQALQLLALQPEAMIGHSVSDVSAVNELFRFLFDTQSTTPFKIVVDNRENYFVKEIIEVIQGESKNKVIVLKNITSYKELDEAKTNFIATISHELKTPLASSDFSIKLLEDERVSKLSGEQRELIGHLKDDNLRMLKILSELLNMSQVEAGRIQLNIALVDPVSILQNAIDNVSAAAKEKKITIINASSNDLSLFNADADKTTWVLNNLLTNAIKFSFSNAMIEVAAKQKDGNIIFSVQDFGPGIASEYLPRLFDRYFQVPGSTEKGSGIGLSISKEFIEAQHGRIWVESGMGKGSTFFFQLPLGGGSQPRC
ncbi:MAG: ATP-binding protein [Ferruginibacter sp.]